MVSPQWVDSRHVKPPPLSVGHRANFSAEYEARFAMGHGARFAVAQGDARRPRMGCLKSSHT